MPWQTPQAEMHNCTWLHSSCSWTAGRCNLHDNYRSWTLVAPQEPWGLVLELAHTHAHLMSIHSHWGSETCSAEGSSPGSVLCRQARSECCAAAPTIAPRRCDVFGRLKREGGWAHSCYECCPITSLLGSSGPYLVESGDHSRNSWYARCGRDLLAICCSRQRPQWSSGSGSPDTARSSGNCWRSPARSDVVPRISSEAASIDGQLALWQPAISSLTSLLLFFIYFSCFTTSGK